MTKISSVEGGEIYHKVRPIMPAQQTMALTSGRARHYVVGGAVIIAFLAYCSRLAQQRLEPPFGATDIRAGLTQRILAGLTRIKPKLNRPSHDARRNFPYVRRLIFKYAVAHLYNRFSDLIVRQVFFNRSGHDKSPPLQEFCGTASTLLRLAE
jgi:hypothetical protein